MNEHLKRESPIHDWHEALRQYRNQIIHRHHSIYLLSGGKTYLPDDPSVYQTTEKPKFDFVNRDIIVPNYTLKCEILKYSQELFSHVLIVIEVIYYSITVHEKFKENFD